MKAKDAVAIVGNYIFGFKSCLPNVGKTIFDFKTCFPNRGKRHLAANPPS